MSKPIRFFAATVSGTEVLKINDDESVTVPTLSKSVLLPAFSTIIIIIDGTAAIDIISDPFNDITKSIVLQNVIANKQYILAGASMVRLNVTAVTGTVYALAIPNQE
jgi:hypothetical protein